MKKKHCVYLYSTHVLHVQLTLLWLEWSHAKVMSLDLKSVEWNDGKWNLYEQVTFTLGYHTFKLPVHRQFKRVGLCTFKAAAPPPHPYTLTMVAAITYIFIILVNDEIHIPFPCPSSIPLIICSCDMHGLK